jgi:hypothetical protein
MLSLFLSHQVIAVEKYGNYLDSRIGIPSEISSHGLLFYPDRELMYDFDTEKPTAGITSENSKIVPDNKYFMTSPNSLRWESKTGSVLNFTSGVKLIKTLKCNYYFSVGLFQEKKTTDGSLRTFKVEAKDEAGNLVVNLQLYLHRCGWNIAAIQLPATFTKVISKIEIMQNGGAEGEVYVDNLMLYNGYMAGISSSPNIYEPTVTDKSAFPAKSTLSADEVKGFKAINDRILNTQDPKVFNLQELEKTDKNNNSQTSKLNRVSPTTMTRFRDLYKSYNIQQIGKFANGENPLYYSRKLQGYDLQEASPEDYYYKKNTTLCQTMREMGMTWYRLSDSPERAELGKMICDLVRLSTTYGGLPNPWYNGRGFADGIFFARELLAKEGLIDDITEQLMQQYNVDRVLYNEHTLNITKKSTRTLAVSNPSTPEFYWNSTADHLNTASLSMISIVAMSPDSPEKARDFIRLKSWLDNIALNYAPSTMGTLKPDGSLFHHWGNRFDNYGWVAGWRGATQYVWWLSKTPFRVSEQTHQRMQHMAKVHFQLMNKDGYAGSPDKQMPIPADGFYFMASAGSPDGSQVYDPLTASYLLSFPESETYRKFPEVIANIKKQGITEAPRANENITMSYAGLNIHRFGSWQAYAHGVSKSLYHTQYVRRGFLFYNIGGFNLLKEGQTSSMQNEKGASILRGKTEEKNITPGYNFSLAPGVTSIVNDLSKLDQKYYQNGSSEFVGGVSTNDNSGIFTQIFDSGDNFNDVDPKDKEFREVSTNKNIYAGTVAEKLSFKKSYFYFGRDIVLIASNISNGVKLTNVQTGILQERVIDGANRLILADKTSTEADTVDREIKSTEVPWFVNETQKIGYYLYPNQTYRLKKGIQTFISTGEIVSSYFEHQKQIVGEYAFVLRLETSKDEMKEFGKSMKSKTPDYQILQQDANAHIVKATKINQTGYVLYNPKGLIFDDKRIKSVNNSCVFMMKDDLAKKEMIISFANPDKNMILTKDNPLGYSLPIKTVVVLNGRYELISADNKLVNCEFDTSNQTTNITFEVKDGLSNTVRLQMSNH